MATYDLNCQLDAESGTQAPQLTANYELSSSGDVVSEYQDTDVISVRYLAVDANAVANALIDQFNLYSLWSIAYDGNSSTVWDNLWIWVEFEVGGYSEFEWNRELVKVPFAEYLSKSFATLLIRVRSLLKAKLTPKLGLVPSFMKATKTAGFQNGYKIRFKNAATATLRGQILAGFTTLRVGDGQGARFPDVNPAKGEYFMCVLMHPWSNSWEVVKVTERYRGPYDRPGEKDTFKIVRAQEGTTAMYFPGGEIR